MPKNGGEITFCINNWKNIQKNDNNEERSIQERLDVNRNKRTQNTRITYENAYNNI